MSRWGIDCKQRWLDVILATQCNFSRASETITRLGSTFYRAESRIFGAAFFWIFCFMVYSGIKSQWDQLKHDLIYRTFQCLLHFFLCIRLQISAQRSHTFYFLQFPIQICVKIYRDWCDSLLTEELSSRFRLHDDTEICPNLHEASPYTNPSLPSVTHVLHPVNVFLLYLFPDTWMGHLRFALCSISVLL